MIENEFVSTSGGSVPLVVWSADPEAAAPLLAALATRHALELCSDLSAVGNLLAEGAKTGVLLLYTSSVELLCRAMVEDVPPSAALADWQAQTEVLLGLNRRNRRQVQLLEIGLARAHPEAFCRQFGLSNAILAEKEPEAQDALLVLMAQRVLTGQPRARRLMDELSAVSLDLSDGTMVAGGDPDRAFQAYREMRRAGEGVQTLLQAQSEATQNELVAALADRDALAAALRAAQEDGGRRQQDADLLRAQNQALQDELSASAAGRDDMTAALQVAAAEKSQSRQELELLQAQTETTQNELAAALTDRDALAAALRAAQEDGGRRQQDADLLRAQNLALQDELSVLAAGRERLTVSLAVAEERLLLAQQEAELMQTRARAVQEEMEALSAQRLKLDAALFSAETAARESKTEASLLQAQTGLMRQEIEVLALDRRQLEQRLVQLQQGIDSYQAQMAALSAERERLTRRGDEKDRSFEAAGAALQDMGAQVEHLTERLERLREDREAALRLADERSQAVAAKEAEIHRIMQSKSFRLTAPLRRFRSLFAGRGQE